MKWPSNKSASANPFSWKFHVQAVPLQSSIWKLSMLLQYRGISYLIFRNLMAIRNSSIVCICFYCNSQLAFVRKIPRTLFVCTEHKIHLTWDCPFGYFQRSHVDCLCQGFKGYVSWKVASSLNKVLSVNMSSPSSFESTSQPNM
jgi:hypothetical protein